MKTKLDCYPCFLRIALQAARLSGADEEMQAKIMRETLALLQKPIGIESPLKTAKQVQDIVRRLTQCEDPYLQLKHDCNEQAESFLPSLRKELRKVKDPLLTALKFTVIGNIMDYGAFAEFDLASLLRKVDEQDFSLNSYDSFSESLKSAKTLSYITDNTGEIFFDYIFIEHLCQNYPVERVQLVIRNENFLNDVSSEEFIPKELKNLPQVEVTPLSIVRNEQDEGVWNQVISSDLILAKGMANFENYSDEENFNFLFIAKCDLVSVTLSQMLDQDIKTGDWIFWNGEKNNAKN